MGLHEAIFDRLSNYAGLTALVGAAASARIYPDEAPPGVARPYIVFWQPGDENHHLSGSDAGIVTARLQFDCYDEDQDDARAVGAQVVAALSRYGGTHAGVVIQTIFIENRFDGVEDDTRLKVRVIDTIVWYEGT